MGDTQVVVRLCKNSSQHQVWRSVDLLSIDLISSKQPTFYPLLFQRTTPFSFSSSLHCLPNFHSSQARPRHPAVRPPINVKVQPTPMFLNIRSRMAKPIPANEHRTMLFAARAPAGDLGWMSTRRVPHTCFAQISHVNVRCGDEHTLKIKAISQPIMNWRMRATAICYETTSAKP